MKTMASRAFYCLAAGFLALHAAAQPGEAGAQRGPGQAPRVAGPTADPTTGAAVVVIPPDWAEHYPFSERLAALAPTPSSRHVIDLATIRFVTDTLIEAGIEGGRRFLAPDTSSFQPDLIRQPFAVGDSDLFIVQAVDAAGQIGLRKWVEAGGFEILDYLPDLAYLVRLDVATWERLPEVSQVFWAGLFQPGFRIHPKLDYVIESDPGHELKIRVLFDLKEYASAAELAEALGGIAETALLEIAPSDRAWIVRLAGTARSARALAAQRGCLWVEQYVDFELHNNIARTSANTTTGRGAVAGPIMDVEDVWARGIRGEGQIASAADTGLSTGTITTVDSLHWDFGQTGSGTNPMRVLKGYALGRSTWDDNQTTGGGHGTHTSGSIVGNGIRSGSAPSTNTFPSTSFAGTAPKAQFVFQSIMDSSGALGGIPADLANLFQQTYADGARVHSNSWGAAVAGSYNTDSQNLDKFAWNYKDMVITFSAGNSGTDSTGRDGVINTDSIGAPGTAKNCITVGASENYRPDFIYEYPEADCTGTGFTQQAWGWFNGTNFPAAPIYADLMANNANGMGAFSSRGPTNDGRFKPEITAPGIAIISTRTNLNQAYEQWGICNVPSSPENLRPHYLTMGGTSMANPLTAGTAVLVRQYYVDGWHPNNTATTNASANAADGFNPSAALVKATLINGAWDMAPGQYGSTSPQPEIPPNWDRSVPRDLPNNAEGFGRVDLEHSLFPGSGWGDDAARRLQVHDVAPGLRTWVSPETCSTSWSASNIGCQETTITVGGNADPLIVTLAWTDPYGAVSAATELINNLDLEVYSPSATRYYPNRKDWTGGTQDAKNNVEQVYVSAPASGTWTVRVRGTAVPGNGVSGTTTQPYALAISGILTTCTPPGKPLITSISDENACVQSGIRVNFTGGSGATSHNLVRDGSVVVTGYTSGALYNPADTTSHSYVVRAVGTGGCTTDSDPVSATDATAPATPAAPTVTDLDACALSGVQVAWSAVSGATAYDLLVDGSTTVAGVTSPYTYTPGNTASHIYQVRARNASCTSAWSSSTSGTDANAMPATPGAPSVTDADSCALSGVQVAWSPASGATAYDLLVDGATTVAGVTSPYTYAPGNSSSHTYQVRGRNATCTGAWSSATAGTDGNAMPGTPGAPSVTDLDSCALSGVQVAWTAVAGATAYDLYVDGTTLVQNVTNPTTYAPGNNDSHTYQARAKNATCTGAWSAATSGTDRNDCNCLVPPTFAGLASVTELPAGSACGLRLGWSAGTSNCPSGPVVTYGVYRRTGTDAFAAIATCVTDTTYDDTSAIAGITYDYLVRAEDSTSASTGPCNHGNLDANAVSLPGTVSLLDETASQQTTPLTATSGSAASNLGPAFTIVSPTSASLSYTSSYSSGGTTVDLFGPDDDPYNSGDWTIVGSNQTATHCGRSTNFARVNQDQYMTLDSGLVSTVGYTNVRVIFDWTTFNMESGDTLSLEYYNGSGWVSASWSGMQNTWTCGQSVTLPAAAAGVADFRVRYLCNGNAVSANERCGLDYVIIRADSVGGSGTWTDNAQVELVDPSNTTTVLKAFGVADANPYDVLTYYTGPGTYQVLLREDAGGTAQITSAELHVLGTECVPGPVENVQFFTARSTAGANKLEWQNPAGSYGSTRICWSTSAYPADPAACGANAVDVPGSANAYDFYPHSSGNGTKVYYTAFVDNGSGTYSSGKRVSGTPFDTPAELRWTYSTGASSLAPAGINPGALDVGSVYAVSNDRVLHGMNATAAGGDWPRGGTFDWTPLAMNAPAQHRPGVLPLAAGKRIVLASQDGYAYCADAGAGGSHPGTVWVSNDGTLPLQLGTMLQAGPTGMYADFVPGAVNRTFVGTRNATAANQVSALDPADGHEVYAFTDSSAQNGDGLGIGIVTGLTVDYATSRLYFTSRGWGGGSSNTVWCVSMGASTATRVWAVNKGDIDGSPVLHNGRLYVGTNAGWVYALDPADGSEVWSYNAANGPVKGYVYPHFGSTPLKLYFSTTDKIWALQENGTSTPTKLWEVTAVPSPSTPLLLASANLLLAGGNDGRLYQFDVNSPGTTLTSRLLGTGTIGSPGLDGVNNLALAGSSAGVVYAVSVPLS